MVGVVVAVLVSAAVGGDSTDWDVVILDKILAGVAPGQNLVQVGDMFIKVSNLTAWRNQLAGGPQPLNAFDGTIQLWTGGNVYTRFPTTSPQPTRRRSWMAQTNGPRSPICISSRAQPSPTT